MDRYDWGRLSHLQVGKYAEYFTKMEFTLYGFDVYTAEVDNKGIDFVVRKDHTRYYDVQVKSVRGRNYIFVPKKTWGNQLRENLLLAVVLFDAGESPKLYIIPSTRWHQPDELFVVREYEGKLSIPEWGLNVSRKNMP
ncbi:MAG TPA: DUF4365 domain-containing protein, partial [Chloroflexia bacterium]|nr:DUF4365 domain-containing protein [Chloroflexia bacterium]